MSAERRRTSKLRAAGAGPIPTQPASQADDQNARRPERVSFNCKLDADLQRAVRHHAVDTGLHIQDIVDFALREYLAARDLPDR